MGGSDIEPAHPQRTRRPWVLRYAADAGQGIPVPSDQQSFPVPVEALACIPLRGKSLQQAVPLGQRVGPQGVEAWGQGVPHRVQVQGGYHGVPYAISQARSAPTKVKAPSSTTARNAPVCRVVPSTLRRMVSLVFAMVVSDMMARM